jgi:hypothetical protein
VASCSENNAPREFGVDDLLHLRTERGHTEDILRYPLYGKNLNLLLNPEPRHPLTLWSTIAAE